MQVNGMGYGHQAFRDLVEIVGELPAERLSIECGGRYFYLGMRVDKDASLLPDLVRCLGTELTKATIHRYPSPHLEIPLYGKIRARNRMILLLREQYKIADLARMFSLSDRMVRNILRTTGTEFNDLSALTQTRAR